MSAEDYFPHLLAVDSLDRITDKTDIDEAVKYCRLLLATFQKIPVHQTTVTAMIIARSGDFLHRAFTLTNNPEYLDECIDVHRHILQTSDAHWAQFQVIVRLIRSLSSRFKLLKDRKDFDEMMQLFPIAANNTYTTVTTRFEVACRWAHLARIEGDSSMSTAYETAMSLMQDALTFAPTLEIQHSHLFTMRSDGDATDVEKLPLDYASYLASNDPPKLEEAIETLERGRGLLWSEMRGLRTSIDNLHRVDPPLARKFADLNGDLEALTTSVSPMVQSNGGGVNGDGEQDTFSRIVLRQRKLLDERNSLITQIRLLPGFENFLMAPSFDILRSAAAHGPVIIVNHCNRASHIVILLYDSPPSIITTSDDFFDRAKSLRDQLLIARKKRPDSMDYQNALTSVLEVLYDLVGKPVIKRLQELDVPEQSRIWWCPTSVFCSLPLHAMGPIRSEGPHKLYFSDLYIPSYTPTLSALIESRKYSSHSFEMPSILLVALPGESMPGAQDEIKVIKNLRHLETTVTALISKKAKPSAVLRCLQDHRFAHFICHGILEAGKPFDASFKLHDDKRLTLLKIIRSQLPSAEFAFLSACHTAEVTEESFADEGLHLSAAVQYSGFRSVVGTMWAMADIDGQVLTKHFYASVFSEKWEGVPYYARTAEALRDAVQELRRKKRMTTERWVNFVHYGA
jgi:CHAT domain-containing protein